VITRRAPAGVEPIPQSKMPREMCVRLGGFATAKKRGADGMALIGSRGGQATLEAHGRGHFIRAAWKRWHPESAIGSSCDCEDLGPMGPIPETDPVQ
jgi:hypothetical protein